MDPQQFGNLPPKAFEGFQRKQMLKIPQELLTEIKPSAFGKINPNAFAGFKPDKFNGLPEDLIGEIDGDQFGELKPKLIGKMDDEIINSLKPKAFEGMTVKQGKKMSQNFARKLDNNQIHQISVAALAATESSVLNVIEDSLQPSQLDGLDGLVGDGQDIGGPVI